MVWWLLTFTMSALIICSDWGCTMPLMWAKRSLICDNLVMSNIVG